MERRKSSSAWRVLASPRGGSALVAQVALERLLDLVDALRVTVLMGERLPVRDAALVEDPELGRLGRRAVRIVGLDAPQVRPFEDGVPLARRHARASRPAVVAVEAAAVADGAVGLQDHEGVPAD